MTDEKRREPIMSSDEWAQTTEALITPVDFDALVQAGVLEKRKGWYKILKGNELPEHAKAKIYQIKSDSDGKALVKFSPVDKKLENMLRDWQAGKK
jgi:hypothetical protein